MQLTCIYIFSLEMKFWLSLQWDYGFSEWMNNYTESFGILYNLICMYLVFVAVLLSFWLSFILVNYSFKNSSGIEKIILNYVFSGVNAAWKRLYNISISDRICKFLDLNDKQEFTNLEAAWSAIPVSFIGMVSVPSVGLEYSISPDVTPAVTLKIIGHQWYWQYEVTTKVHPGLIETTDNSFLFKSLSYKTFLDNKDDSDALLSALTELEYFELKKTFDVSLVSDNYPFLRGLGTDCELLLPVNTPIKIIVTSADVIHSFALPAGAVKVDAIPGRLSEQVIIFERPGLFFGQCSELCGPYHGFMPILIEVVSYDSFIKWMLRGY